MDELRKEIRRLLWNSFISARAKTLRKQEGTERKKVHALERADEVILGRTIDKLEEIKSRLRRWGAEKGVDTDVLEVLIDHIVEVLRSKLS